MPVIVNDIMEKKKLLQWKAWFVDQSDSLMRFDSETTDWRDLPEDGFLLGKTLLVDACQENISGDGWLVIMETPNGLLFQTTGGEKPEEKRYPDSKFCRCKLASTATMHLAVEESNNCEWKVITIGQAKGKSFLSEEVKQWR